MLNDEQQAAVDHVLMNRNVLLTGGAGVGKSFTLKKMVEALRKAGKRVAVTAMTGSVFGFSDNLTHCKVRLGIGGWDDVSFLFKDPCTVQGDRLGPDHCRSEKSVQDG